MIPDILERLQSLQDILSKKYKLEAELKDIPKSIQTRVEVLSRIKKQYLEKNENYETSKIRVVELKGKIEQASKDRETSEAMIVNISTQREYEALLKQIKDANDREQQFRKDLSREEKYFEELSEEIEREEQSISEQETELKTENEKINEEVHKRSKEIASLEIKENEITKKEGLDSEIVFKFRRIIRKKEGRGIVPLRKGVCTGCNMILPMEFVNEVRSADSIHFCPYCSMILFHEDTDDTYFDFDIDALNPHEDDDRADDEELDEGLLMEEEMNEEDEDEEGAEDEGEDDIIEDDDIEDEEDEVDEDIVEDITETSLEEAAELEADDVEDEIEDEN